MPSHITQPPLAMPGPEHARKRTASPAAATALSSLRAVSRVHALNMATMAPSHARWKAGTIARRRGFHVSRSAGMSPLPMMGSRISASTPLS